MGQDDSNTIPTRRRVVGGMASAVMLSTLLVGGRARAYKSLANVTLGDNGGGGGGGPLPEEKNLAAAGAVSGWSAALGATVVLTFGGATMGVGLIIGFAVIGLVGGYFGGKNTDIALDPPQPDYMRVAIPADLDVGSLSFAPSLTPEHHSLIQGMLDLFVVLAAYLDALERRQFAESVSDAYWIDIHQSSMASLGNDISSRAGILRELADTIADAFDMYVPVGHDTPFDPNDLDLSSIQGHLDEFEGFVDLDDRPRDLPELADKDQWWVGATGDEIRTEIPNVVDNLYLTAQAMEQNTGWD